MAEDEVDAESTMMTTAMLKAFTHPLRRRIAVSFNSKKYLRASDIAEMLGEPANKISFHLRVLADAGLIVEAPEQARDRRDRVWTAGVEGSLSIAAHGQPAPDPLLANAVVRGMVEDHQNLLARVVKTLPDYLAGKEDEAHGYFSSAHFTLTSAEFDDMMKKISAIVQEARDAHVEGTEDSRLFHMDVVAADDRI